MAKPPSIRRLGPGDLLAFRAMNGLFAAAFEEPEQYTGAPPSNAYVDELLGREGIIALVAETEDQRVIGAIVAYELDKFEQARREIYIYDLAVAEDFRRQGIATALITDLRRIAQARGAYTLYVQADPEDGPAVALYEKLGTRADVFHFDIELTP